MQYSTAGRQRYAIFHCRETEIRNIPLLGDRDTQYSTAGRQRYRKGGGRGGGKKRGGNTKNKRKRTDIEGLGGCSGRHVKHVEGSARCAVRRAMSTDTSLFVCLSAQRGQGLMRAM